MTYTRCKRCECLSTYATAHPDSLCGTCANRRERIHTRILFTCVGIVIGLILLLAAYQPYLEARTFNKFTTGPKATYWDAVFGSLRVISK